MPCYIYHSVMALTNCHAMVGTFIALWLLEPTIGFSISAVIMPEQREISKAKCLIIKLVTSMNGLTRFATVQV